MQNHKAKLEPQIWSSVLRSLLLPLAEQGVDTPKLLVECGIDVQELEHPNGQVPLSRYISFMNRASQETGDRLLGIRLSKFIGPELLGALGFLFLSSRSLFEGLNAICHYQNLFQESTKMSLEKSGEYYFFRYDLYGLGTLDTRIDIELSIAFTARLIRLYSNNDVKPLKIEFRHAPAQQIKKYQQLLSVPCYFNQDTNGVYIRAEDARFKGRRFDPELTRILKNYLDTDLASKNSVNLFSEQVKRAIIDTQGQEFPTAPLIANRLGLSVATFYRRLKSENVSFKAILDEQYFEFARHYLTDTQLNVYQIAHLLGFSTSSGFIRAFKKWSGGKSPLNYRKLM